MIVQDPRWQEYLLGTDENEYKRFTMTGTKVIDGNTGEVSLTFSDGDKVVSAKKKTVEEVIKTIFTKSMT